MKKIEIFRMESLYRAPLVVSGWVFGEGAKNTVVVGPTRGNEVQQLYICSQLVRTLKRIEEDGRFIAGKQVEVIPVVNSSSINVGKRFWAMDGTDVNRMFPGYDEGETTQRIAGGVFRHLQGWKNGIQLSSYYLRGDFVPHVRMMQTPYQSPDAGDPFGLPFVVQRKTAPIDTTTLNYNWQIWNTRAFSMYTQATSHIDTESAEVCIWSILRFLVSEKVIRLNVHPGTHSVHLMEDELARVHSPQAGIFVPSAGPSDFVEKGGLLGFILDPMTGETLKEVRSKTSGTVFFAYRDPLVMDDQLLFLIVKRLSGAV